MLDFSGIPYFFRTTDAAAPLCSYPSRTTNLWGRGLESCPARLTILTTPVRATTARPTRTATVRGTTSFSKADTTTITVTTATATTEWRDENLETLLDLRAPPVAIFGNVGTWRREGVPHRYERQ